MSAKSMEDIAELFKRLKFRKKVIGGVDEADVWKQLEMLQKEYQSAYEAQEEYYQALLDERNAMISRLKKRGLQLERSAGESDE